MWQDSLRSSCQSWCPALWTVSPKTWGLNKPLLLIKPLASDVHHSSSWATTVAIRWFRYKNSSWGSNSKNMNNPNLYPAEKRINQRWYICSVKYVSRIRSKDTQHHHFMHEPLKQYRKPKPVSETCTPEGAVHVTLWRRKTRETKHWSGPSAGRNGISKGLPGSMESLKRNLGTGNISFVESGHHVSLGPCVWASEFTQKARLCVQSCNPSSGKVETEGFRGSQTV